MYGRHGYKARMSSPPAQDNNWSLIHWWCGFLNRMRSDGSGISWE